MRVLFSFFLFYSFVVLNSQQLKFVFAGDIMGHGPQINAAYDSVNDIYDYEPCFRYIKPYISKADIAIANLEIVLGGKPYTGYPVFSSPDELALEIKNAGFDILVTANNHSYDKGKFGFERTISFLDSIALPHLGTYKDQASRDSLHPMIFEKNGFRIALLNYTYGTNGIVPEKPNVVNYIDKETIVTEISIARQKQVDFIIAIMHWGAEYMLTPNKEQKELAHFLAKEGCHAIVGSHPHVVQTFEMIYPFPDDSTISVPVFYSLGNFVSNQRNRYRDGGAMFSFTIEKSNSRIFVKDLNYIPYWVYKGVLQNKFQYYILPLNFYRNDTASFPLLRADKDSLIRYSQDIKVQLPNLQEDTVKVVY